MTDNIIDTRYPVLEFLDNAHGRTDYVKLLNVIHSATALTPMQTRALLMQMQTDGLISGKFTSSSAVHLEPAGTVLLLQLQNSAEHQSRQEAKAERNQRFNNQIAIASILVSVLVFILGLLAGHQIDIRGFLSALFANFTPVLLQL